MRVTVFGLGEAGSLIAADLVAAGAEVHAFDPADVDTPHGVTRHEQPETSVAGSTLIIAATAAADARQAIGQAAHQLPGGAVYADVSTASPDLKRDLAEVATSSGVSFADVALMAPVHGNGLATPSLVSGEGAVAYAEIIKGLGGSVEVLGGQPGDAAARKLLRSVVTKGLTALLIESLEAASAHGSARWMWEHLVEFVSEADGGLARRLIEGTPRHVDRRIVEMETALALLESLSVPSTMTAATVETLRRIRDQGPGAADPIGDLD